MLHYLGVTPVCSLVVIIGKECTTVQYVCLVDIVMRLSSIFFVTHVEQR